METPQIIKNVGGKTAKALKWTATSALHGSLSCFRWLWTKNAEIRKNNKLNKIRKLEEEKASAVARLEKANAPFQPEKIAEKNQAVFHSLLPEIFGQLQLKRLQTRNEMIREMRSNLDELAETKKSWERLKNIDAEIAVDQALIYQKQMEVYKGKLRHELEMEKLQAELEDFRQERSDPPKPKTTEEQIDELDEKHKIELQKTRHELEIEKEKREFETKHPRPKEESTQDAALNKLIKKLDDDNF